jgi:hypothetical protein
LTDPHPSALPSSSTLGAHLIRFAKTKTGAGNFWFWMTIPLQSLSSSSFPVCCDVWRGLGGRPAASLRRRWILPISRDTLLRVVRRRAMLSGTAPVGIDDFARKRGQRHGTIICDWNGAESSTRCRTARLQPLRHAWLTQGAAQPRAGPTTSRLATAHSPCLASK